MITIVGCGASIRAWHPCRIIDEGTLAVDVRTSTAVYRDAVAYLSYQIE